MEDSDFHYHNEEEIIAGSRKEAVAIYDRRNSMYYFTGSVRTELEETDEPKTSDEPLDKVRNQHRIDFYNRDKRWKG